MTDAWKSDPKFIEWMVVNSYLQDTPLTQRLLVKPHEAKLMHLAWQGATDIGEEELDQIHNLAKGTAIKPDWAAACTGKAGQSAFVAVKKALGVITIGGVVPIEPIPFVRGTINVYTSKNCPSYVRTMGRSDVDACEECGVPRAAHR